MDIYEKMKRYQVQAKSVEDFRQRFTKPDRYQKRGPEYVAAVLEYAHNCMERFGYTIISRHDSVTGEIVAYYGDQAPSAWTL